MNPSSRPILFAPVPPQFEKPLMVLLPGLDGTGKLFATQVPSLAQHFDLRCLQIPETNRQDWEELAGTIIELIKEARRRRQTYVCGESFGGCLALQIAMMAPTLLNRLIIINPASALRRHLWLRWSTQACGYVPEWLFTTSGTVALAFLANFERIEPTYRQLFVDTVRPISQSCVTWRLRMLYKFVASPERLETLDLPVALIASGRDRLFPSLEEAKLLKQFFPQAKTYFLPDSGHVCLIERDVDLAHCLKELDFLPIATAVREFG